MSLKLKLKEAMKLKKLSLTGLAKRAGVPKQTINDWLSGTSPRNLLDLLSVAKVLNLTIDELVNVEAGSVSSPADSKGEWSHGIYEIKFRALSPVTKKEKKDE